MLPMSSMAMASTSFVSQNMGAKKESRARRGTFLSILLTLLVTGGIAAALFVFAPASIGLFAKDPSVIEFGVLFIRTNVFFLLANCVNHVLAGALRGSGDSTSPMFIMILSFVVIRQIYLFFITRFVANTPRLVGFGYPVGWVCCCVIELAYYYFRNIRKSNA
jgi:Na+-driven multidrug efflux pump